MKQLWELCSAEFSILCLHFLKLWVLVCMFCVFPCFVSVWPLSEHLLNCSPHCEHCLRRNAVEKAGNWISRKSSLSYSASSKPIFQRCHIHSLLFLRQRNIRTFSKTPHGIFPGVTRILINKNMYSERMFTTHIFRAVMRVARVRYFLVGAAGAGGVAAKVVRFILRCSVIFSFYYIDTSVLLENISLVKFIKTTSGTWVVYFP